LGLKHVRRILETEAPPIQQVEYVEDWESIQ